MKNSSPVEPYTLNKLLLQLLDEREFWKSKTVIKLDLPLTVSLYLTALKNGFFPWNNPGDIRTWHSPNPRAVLFLNRFHVSHSLARCVRQKRFEVTFDRDFQGTVLGCANREHTWLDDELIGALQQLHEIGIAHSVESWLNGKLVGGVYGMVIDGLFIGDSMFYTEPNASKVALVKLVEHLKLRGFEAIDCQVLNDHTHSFGARNISRRMFYELANKARDSMPMPVWGCAE